MKQRSPLLIIFFTIFLDLVGFGLVLPLLAQFALLHGAEGATIGLLGAAYSGFQFIFAPFWGRLSDRIGRRPVLLTSIAGSSLAYLIFAFAPNLVVLFIARAFAGAMAGNIGAAQAYIADVTTPQNRARGMGLIGVAFGLGFTLGPALALVVQGQQAVGLLAASLSFIDLILAFFLLPESLPREKRARHVPRGPGRVARMTAALRYPVVGVGVRCFFLTTLAWSTLEVTFPLLLKQNAQTLLGLGPEATAAEIQRWTGGIFALVGLTIAFVQGGLIGPLTRRYGEARLAATGASLAALALLLVPWIPGLALLLPVVILLAAGQGLNIPSLASLISRHAPADSQGSTLGTTASFSTLGRALGPLLGGALYQFGPPAPFTVAACIMAAAALLALTRLARTRGSAEVTVEG